MNFNSEKTFWENAVNSRHSCRSYQARAVENDKLDELKTFAKEMKLPFEHDFEVRFFKSGGRPLANNLKNPPPDCVAFMSNTDLLSVCKTGFAGEIFILYATGLGLSTCWFGHYILPELERVMPHLGEHKNDPMPSCGYAKGEAEGIRAICISPLGYWEQKGLRLVDRISGSMMSFKRKPLADLMLNGRNPDSLPPEIQYALDFGRKAPSGANTQHWRFHVADDNKTITISKLDGFTHFKWEHFEADVGICAAHVWIGLECQGIKCEVEPSLENGCVVWRLKIQ